MLQSQPLSKRVSKNRKLINIFTLIFLVLNMSACTEDPIHKNPESSAPNEDQNLQKVLAQPKNIVFDDVQKLVFAKHCNSCHNPADKKDNVVLVSFAHLSGKVPGIKNTLVPFNPEDSDVYNTLITNGSRHMPPKAEKQLSQQQIQLVYQWVLNGGKVTKDDVVEKPKSLKESLEPLFKSPEKIDFEDVVKYVFEPRCNKCHHEKGSQAEDDILIYSADLTNYETVFDPIKPELVIKGDHSASGIYKSIAVDQKMPPEKKGYNLLNPYEIKLVRLWILNCAIEDFDKIQNDRLSHSEENPDKVRLCEGQ